MKYGLFQITCFKESKNMAIEEASGYQLTVIKNNVFLLSYGIKDIY